MGKRAPVRNVDIKILRAFVSICETKSYKLTAEKLYTATSTLTAQMYKLEGHYGVPLLVTWGQKKIPTHAGWELYRRGKRLLEINDETYDIISKFPPDERFM